MTPTTFRTQPCMHCGVHSNVTLDLTKLKRWVGGAFVQDVWPEKTAPERELLMTGTHPECWIAMFGTGDD